MDAMEPSTVERGLWPIATRAYVEALEANCDNLRLEVQAYQYLTANIRQALVDRGISLEDQRVMLDAVQVGEAAPALPQENHWRWYYSANPEEGPWLGACATREEAIAAARAMEHIGETGFYICTASNPPLRLADYAVEGAEFLEAADEALWDSDRVSSEYDDGNEFHVKPEQVQDLTQRLRRVCDEWQAAHGLEFFCNTFAEMKDVQAVPPVSEEGGQ